MPYVRELSGNTRTYPDDQFTLVRPRTVGGSYASLLCDVVILVAKDRSRVLVGGGRWGYDGIAREADDVEIEALADRFGLAELHEVLAIRRRAEHIP